MKPLDRRSPSMQIEFDPGWSSVLQHTGSPAPMQWAFDSKTAPHTFGGTYIPFPTSASTIPSLPPSPTSSFLPMPEHLSGWHARSLSPSTASSFLTTTTTSPRATFATTTGRIDAGRGGGGESSTPPFEIPSYSNRFRGRSDASSSSFSSASTASSSVLRTPDKRPSHEDLRPGTLAGSRFSSSGRPFPFRQVSASLPSTSASSAALAPSSSSQSQDGKRPSPLRPFSTPFHPRAPAQTPQGYSDAPSAGPASSSPAIAFVDAGHMQRLTPSQRAEAVVASPLPPAPHHPHMAAPQMLSPASSASYAAQHLVVDAVPQPILVDRNGVPLVYGSAPPSPYPVAYGVPAELIAHHQQQQQQLVDAVARTTLGAPTQRTPTSAPASANGGGGRSGGGGKLALYKTELCRSWEEKGSCRYGSKCQFAHGQNDLRPVSRHQRFKTEICKTFWMNGCCPYGKRCCFLHTSAGDGTPADIVTGPGGVPLSLRSPPAVPPAAAAGGGDEKRSSRLAQRTSTRLHLHHQHPPTPAAPLGTSLKSYLGDDHVRSPPSTGGGGGVRYLPDPGARVDVGPRFEPRDTVPAQEAPVRRSRIDRLASSSSSAFSPGVEATGVPASWSAASSPFEERGGYFARQQQQPPFSDHPFEFRPFS